MDRLAFDVGIQRRTTVVAEFKRELLVVHDHFLDARFTQNALHVADHVRAFVLVAQQRPDDAVIDLFTVAGAEGDAVFLQAFVVEAANHGAQRFRRFAERGLQETDRGA